MVLVEYLLYQLFSVGLYIFAGGAICERRKPLNSSSLCYERFRLSNKRPNPLADGHSLLQFIR
jgi:hypothetical protein